MVCRAYLPGLRWSIGWPFEAFPVLVLITQLEGERSHGPVAGRGRRDGVPEPLVYIESVKLPTVTKDEPGSEAKELVIGNGGGWKLKRVRGRDRWMDSVVLFGKVLAGGNAKYHTNTLRDETRKPRRGPRLQSMDQTNAHNSIVSRNQECCLCPRVSAMR